MCWNANISLNTYIFGLFASSFAFYNGDIKMPAFIFYQSIIAIQLIEYFIWSKTFSNRLLSQLGLLLILSQPIFNIIKIESKPFLIPYILVSYLLFVAILYLFIIPINTINFSSVPHKNGHLSWNWLNWNILIILIWYIFLSSRWIIDKIYLSFIFITLLLIITIVLYKKSNTWGSLWCWFCNIFSFYYILKVFYKDICKI